MAKTPPEFDRDDRANWPEADYEPRNQMLVSADHDCGPTLNANQMSWREVRCESRVHWLEAPPSKLPGDRLIPKLRARARTLALGGRTARANPAIAIANTLEQWSAFDRNWIRRLLPPGDADDSGPSESKKNGKKSPTNLDPYTADGKHRLRTVWVELAEELIDRGNRLRGAATLAGGVQELFGEVYEVAARIWPTEKFTYESHEKTLHWLIAILSRLVKRTAFADRDSELKQDAAVQQADLSLSLADERIEIAARLEALHGRLPSDCRLDDLPDRIVGLSTLQLFVPADTFDAVLQLPPDEQRLWGLLAVREAPTTEVAQSFEITPNYLKVKFHRLREDAIEILAQRWATA